MVAQSRCNGCTDQAGRVADHKCHLLGGHVRRRYDQVALILAGKVIEDYYEFAIFCSPYVSRVLMKRGQDAQF